MSARFPITFAVLLAVSGFAACGQGSDAPQEPAGSWPVAVGDVAGAEPQYERVVLVTIDTLRTDHVSCYGYPRETTPFLDSMAARGARFTRAYSAISHTAPSHATMLTGLVPAVHGLVENGGKLDPRATDLAAVFGQAGFETAAFLNVKFLGGIAASFGHVAVRALSEQPGEQRRILNGGDVVDAAIDWLGRERKGGRFLLWVHLYDPHKWKDVVLERASDGAPIWSGATPPDFFERIAELHGLAPRMSGEEHVIDWNVEKKSGEHLEDVRSPEGFLRCIDAYDELVRFADAQVARLYQTIEALALPGRTLWVVTADHGEGLASHGVPGHGPRIYQEQIRVPLVLHASDGSVRSCVVDELVAHVDLFPTLAETLGLEVEGAPRLYEGRSLWPLVSGEGAAGAVRRVFSQRCPPLENANAGDQPRLFSLQDERSKLILQQSGDGVVEFYDLAADPLELVDLGVASREAAKLRAELELRLSAYSAITHAEAGEDVPEEWMRELRELGYAR